MDLLRKHGRTSSRMHASSTHGFVATGRWDPSAKPCSALLDLVALRRSEALVARWGEGLANVGRELGVACAHGPGVGHAGRGKPSARGHLAAAAQEEDGHLHARAADLDLGLLGVAHHEVGEGAALVERTRAHVQTKHWLTLHVHHLVDIELGPLLEAKRGCWAQDKRYRERNLCGGHCVTSVNDMVPCLAGGACS